MDEWWERGAWGRTPGSGAGPLEWTLPPARALQGSNLREAAEEGNKLGWEWDWQGTCHTGLASSSQTHTSPHPESHLLYLVPWPQLWASAVYLMHMPHPLPSSENPISRFSPRMLRASSSVPHWSSSLCLTPRCWPCSCSQALSSVPHSWVSSLALALYLIPIPHPRVSSCSHSWYLDLTHARTHARMHAHTHTHVETTLYPVSDWDKQLTLHNPVTNL